MQTLVKIFLVLITLIGLISGLYQIFSGPLWLGILFLTFSIISAILWGTYGKWKYLWRANFLSNSQEVYEAVEHLLKNSRHITFCGNLDDTLFEKFTQLSSKENKKTRMTTTRSILIFLIQIPIFIFLFRIGTK